MAYVVPNEWPNGEEMWVGKPGSIWEYKERFDYHMGCSTKKQPTLVVPSLWWECVGICTVYVLCCALAYLQTAT